mgnify:CR=1 FL=1
MNFELLVGRPSGSPLFEDYLGGAESAAPFYSGSWQDPKTYRALLDSVDARFDSDARRRALRALKVPKSIDPERIDRWIEQRGAIVTTGQQPGLFGGPLYALYKGISAVRLAERLEGLLAAMGRAEARDLGFLGEGVLYDPAVNYERVKGRVWDWDRDPEPVAGATSTAGITAPDASVSPEDETATVSGY